MAAIIRFYFHAHDHENHCIFCGGQFDGEGGPPKCVQLAAVIVTG